MTRRGFLLLLQAAAVLLVIKESFFDRRWLSLGLATLLLHPTTLHTTPRCGDYCDQPIWCFIEPLPRQVQLPSLAARPHLPGGVPLAAPSGREAGAQHPRAGLGSEHLSIATVDIYIVFRSAALRGRALRVPVRSAAP